MSNTKYARFHGSAGTVVDFGEAPSQFLERFLWLPAQIKALSQHYSTLSPEYFAHWREKTPDQALSDEKMPKVHIDAILTERRLGDALQCLNQVRLCSFDMAIHQPMTHEDANTMDVLELFNQMGREIMPFDDPTDGTDSWGHGYTQDTHLMGEYHAAYYSYLLSVVLDYDAEMLLRRVLVPMSMRPTSSIPSSSPTR